MTHSFKILFFHLIWSTKGRQQWITADVRQRLYPYLGGIIKHQGGELIEIGGMPDHIHLLIKQEILDGLSNHIRDLKANSSRWVYQNFPGKKEFAWQEGYGSFSVSYSAVPQVREYIINQEKHHSSMTFEDEYKKFLKGCGISYDERFVLG